MVTQHNLAPWPWPWPQTRCSLWSMYCKMNYVGTYLWKNLTLPRLLNLLCIHCAEWCGALWVKIFSKEILLFLKVRQSRKQIMLFSILSKNERNSLKLAQEDAQDSGFRSFFARIESTINCFQDLLTFIRNYHQS
jgi:hypothetical protein